MCVMCVVQCSLSPTAGMGLGLGEPHHGDHAGQEPGLGMGIGRPVTLFLNGTFADGRTLFVDPFWSMQDLVLACSRRMGFTVSKVFQSDGGLVTDVSIVNEDDVLFCSSGEAFHPVKHKRKGVVVGGYTVGRKLGQGGFGTVRLGRNHFTGEVVALKFLAKSKLGSTHDAERVLTEIRCFMELVHPNIIRLLQVLDQDKFVVLVLEYAPGGDLNKHLSSFPDRRMPEPAARNLFRDLVKGVSYAHMHHVTHRDLKLENILIASDGTPKLTDFGLSVFSHPDHMLTSSAGSLCYLAPEIVRRVSCKGSAIDVWCLGVLLYTLVCGKLPFESPTGSRADTLKLITRCQPEYPEHLSPELLNLLSHMLRGAPEVRASLSAVAAHGWVTGDLAPLRSPPPARSPRSDLQPTSRSPATTPTWDWESSPRVPGTREPSSGEGARGVGGEAGDGGVEGLGSVGRPVSQGPTPSQAVSQYRLSLQQAACQQQQQQQQQYQRQHQHQHQHQHHSQSTALRAGSLGTMRYSSLSYPKSDVESEGEEGVGAGPTSSSALTSASGASGGRVAGIVGKWSTPQEFLLHFARQRYHKPPSALLGVAGALGGGRRQSRRAGALSGAGASGAIAPHPDPGGDLGAGEAGRGEEAGRGGVVDSSSGLPPTHAHGAASSASPAPPTRSPRRQSGLYAPTFASSSRDKAKAMARMRTVAKSVVGSSTAHAHAQAQAQAQALGPNMGVGSPCPPPVPSHRDAHPHPHHSSTPAGTTATHPSLSPRGSPRPSPRVQGGPLGHTSSGGGVMQGARRLRTAGLDDQVAPLGAGGPTPFAGQGQDWATPGGSGSRGNSKGSVRGSSKGGGGKGRGRSEGAEGRGKSEGGEGSGRVSTSGPASASHAFAAGTMEEGGGVGVGSGSGDDSDDGAGGGGPTRTVRASCSTAPHSRASSRGGGAKDLGSALVRPPALCTTGQSCPAPECPVSDGELTCRRRPVDASGRRPRATGSPPCRTRPDPGADRDGDASGAQASSSARVRRPEPVSPIAFRHLGSRVALGVGPPPQGPGSLVGSTHSSSGSLRGSGATATPLSATRTPRNSRPDLSSMLGTLQGTVRDSIRCARGMVEAAEEAGGGGGGVAGGAGGAGGGGARMDLSPIASPGSGHHHTYRRRHRDRDRDSDLDREWAAGQVSPLHTRLREYNAPRSQAQAQGHPRSHPHSQRFSVTICTVDDNQAPVVVEQVQGGPGMGRGTDSSRPSTQGSDGSRSHPGPGPCGGMAPLTLPSVSLAASSLAASSSMSSGLLALAATPICPPRTLEGVVGGRDGGIPCAPAAIAGGAFVGGGGEAGPSAVAPPGPAPPPALVPAPASAPAPDLHRRRGGGAARPRAPSAGSVSSADSGPAGGRASAEPRGRGSLGSSPGPGPHHPVARPNSSMGMQGPGIAGGHASSSHVVAGAGAMGAAPGRPTRPSSGRPVLVSRLSAQDVAVGGVLEAGGSGGAPRGGGGCERGTAIVVAGGRRVRVASGGSGASRPKLL